MISQVEAALAAAISDHADPELRSKIGLFMADHPGLLARAAIEAMREPTEAMVDAGYEAGGYTPDPSNIEGAWRAMIDAALGK